MLSRHSEGASQPTATDSLVNHLLGQLESLYFALYDEFSDKRKVLAEQDEQDTMAKVAGFIELEQEFTTYSHVGRFL